MNNGSDMKPEKVSTIRGEIAINIEAKRLNMRLSEAIKQIDPKAKILIEKRIMLSHLAISMKSPFFGVKKLNINGNKGGNSVTLVVEPLEFRIIAPFPA
jgi:hypothetical protein